MRVSKLARAILQDEANRNRGVQFELNRSYKALADCESSDDINSAWHLLKAFEKALALYEKDGEAPEYQQVLQQLADRAKQAIHVIRAARGLPPLTAE